MRIDWVNRQTCPTGCSIRGTWQGRCIICCAASWVGQAQLLRMCGRGGGDMQHSVTFNTGQCRYIPVCGQTSVFVRALTITWCIPLQCKAADAVKWSCLFQVSPQAKCMAFKLCMQMQGRILRCHALSADDDDDWAQCCCGLNALESDPQAVAVGCLQ